MVNMILYQVQLEAYDDIYSLEVLTDDYDAVYMAKNHMTEITGKDWSCAHVGCLARIGEENSVKKVVRLTNDSNQ